MKIRVLTRCTRPDRLYKVEDSIFKNIPKGVHLKWKIIYDTSVIKSENIESTIFGHFSKYDFVFQEGVPGDMAHCLLNNAIDIEADDTWIYVLDDDNEMHPDFLTHIYDAISLNSKISGIIVSQYVGGKDFSGVQIREAKPVNTKLKHIDMAQFILKKSLIGNKRLIPNTYVADGIFIEELYKEKSSDFIFINKVLSNYNSITPAVIEKSYTLPRVVTMNCLPNMKSWKANDFESDDLNIKAITNENAWENIAKNNPDAIITTGETAFFPALNGLPYDFRQRWIHIDVNDPNAGEATYQCAMNYILNPDVSNLISIFTPIYNTKDKLLRAYQSVKNQTYENWEWILVNDSTDDITLKIAENIAKKDPRVKVYDFKEKTKGIIGESKYRACAMSKGNYLLEFDHDDYLMPFALEKIINAFQKYPDVGFVSTDCAEIDENYNSLTYGEYFSFGYGSYREETYNGITFQVINTSNINPMTIRHIVGVPNHIRCWKRDIYFQIGGHNRRLSIADDYELIVRTFLVTKFAHISKCCYLQFYHGGNSQDSTRSDIQRRVRTIAAFYNQKIKARFEELGKEDWAYTPNSSMWGIEPRKGEEEGYVNYIITE